MSYSTVYDVRVRYGVENRGARSGTQGLTDDVRKLGSEAKRTSGIFGRLGVAVVGAFGARAAGKALIGFNATVQDTKNQIAGMLALSKKTDLSDQISSADRLYSRLQVRAKSLPGTTQEYVSMLGMLTQPLSNAGATMKEMEDLTVNSVVGAKALGVEWQAAARDIDQALRGQFHSQDQFTGKILGSMGYQGEEGRARYNALDAGKRMDVLKAALMQKQLTQLAAAQGDTFNGQLSTLQDTVEQFLGKVGLPLFKAITNELKHWNTWIDANSDKVEMFASKLGQGLVEGFKYVKDVLSFLVDHREMLMSIGKVWLAVKVGQGVGKGVNSLSSLFGAGEGNGGTGLKGLMGWFRGSRDSFDKDGNYQYTPAGRGRQGVGGAKGVMENAGGIATSFAVGYSIGKMIDEETGLSKSIAGAVEVNGKLYDVTDKATRQFVALERSSATLDAALQRVAKDIPGATGATIGVRGVATSYEENAAVVQALQKAIQDKNIGRIRETQGVLNERGVTEEDIKAAGGMQGYIDSMHAKAGALTAKSDLAGGATLIAMTVGVNKLTEYQKKTLETEQAQEELSRYMVQQISKGKLIDPETVMDILRHNTQDPTGSHKNVADKPKVNVTIQRIEVQSDDPDRMAFGLLESFRDAAKNPSSALSSLREG